MIRHAAVRVLWWKRERVGEEWSRTREEWKGWVKVEKRLVGRGGWGGGEDRRMGEEGKGWAGKGGNEYEAETGQGLLQEDGKGRETKGGLWKIRDRKWRINDGCGGREQGCGERVERQVKRVHEG